MKKTDNTLMQYVRDRKGNPRGIVVASLVNERVRFGWSFTNTSAGDRFNKKMGLRIAHNRAVSGWRESVIVPLSVQKVMEKMTVRAERYFNTEIGECDYDYQLSP